MISKKYSTCIINCYLSVRVSRSQNYFYSTQMMNEKCLMTMIDYCYLLFHFVINFTSVIKVNVLIIFRLACTFFLRNITFHEKILVQN